MAFYHGSGRRNPERTQQMISQARAGLTLAQIGERYSLSRERVRQILASHGVSAADRGVAVRKAARRQHYRNAVTMRREHRAFKIYGCGYDEAKRLNDGRSFHAKGCPTQRYRQQKRNAEATRGIRFLLTFPQWMSVWTESGHWDSRGRGHGKYVMSRIGDRGDYCIGNVFIQMADQNNSEGTRNAIARGCYDHLKKAA